MALYGLPFDCCVAEAEEISSGPADYVAYENARRKARAAAEKYSSGIIIGADTVVSVDGVPLGKPKDATDARRMLKMLSGRQHRVFTGLAVIDAATGREESAAEGTDVCFAELSEEEIAAYVATGEPMDKAGAYGIQGRGGIYIYKINGCYNNVVGLPTALLYKMLKSFGVVF